MPDDMFAYMASEGVLCPVSKRGYIHTSFFKKRQNKKDIHKQSHITEFKFQTQQSTTNPGLHNLQAH
jgi:hypothetical protein